jgi:hypothetical protein
MQEQQQQTRLQEIYGKLNAGTATIADRIELGDISGSEATRKGIWETIGRMDENALNARIGTTQQFAFALNKNPELAKSMMDDYLRANPADQTMKTHPPDGGHGPEVCKRSVDDGASGDGPAWAERVQGDGW